MTGIDRYISELLFDHDCVILPGVGGFLTNYSGARIHPVRHSFQPASRTVVFNTNLRTNDGLLIDHVARSGGTTYQEASTLVHDYAGRLMNEIRAGKTFYLNNIGNLKMGAEGNIIFDPDPGSNYLADAFGLPSFVSPAIQRETVRQRLEKQLTPKPVSHDKEKRRVISPVAGWAAGILIPVAAAALLYFFNPTFVERLGDSYASFVPTVTFTPAEDVGKPAKKMPANELSNFRIIPEKVMESSPAEMQETPVAPEQPVIQSMKRYQVVVGSFADEHNAGKYVAELRSRYRDAGIVGTNAGGLVRVSIGGSDSKQEALGMLEVIRQKENPSAWLLRVR